MPIVDGIKTVAECVNNGIEQAKDDKIQQKECINKNEFDVANSDDETRGVSVAYDSQLFRRDDTK